MRANIGFCPARVLCGLTRIGRSTSAAACVRVRGSESLCRRCVWVGRVVASFVRSTAVRYRTVTSERRFFRPVGATGSATTFIPRQRSGGSGCLGRRHGGAPCAKRVREGGAGASQYTWSAVAVPSPPLSSPTAICPKWTRAGPRVFAAHLARVRQASLKSTSPMPCQCAMGPGQQAGREMWHAVLVRPAENCGVLSCVLEALER